MSRLVTEKLLLLFILKPVLKKGGDPGDVELSRAITSGVAATVNDEMRRMQLATLNAVAFSMVPLAPDHRARGLASSGAKFSMTARPSISSNSLMSLHTRLTAIISRDDYPVSLRMLMSLHRCLAFRCRRCLERFES